MVNYIISTGRSRTEQEWKAKSVTWEQLTHKLSKPKVTSETFAEYQSMPRMKKGQVKDVGGFVGGSFTGGQRRAQDAKTRSLVTLDIDYGRSDTIGVVEDMMAGTAWCLYSTHSHSSSAPRYRLIVPLSREVTPDEYIPVARRIAEQIGIEVFDDSTYQPERLMYWPSVSRDGEYVFKEEPGDPADADALLASYKDWRDTTEWPVSSRVQKISAPRGKKQEDPTEKAGVIGAFCRAYTISEAIAVFLSDVYEPCGTDGRYTFIGGSTVGGAVAYEDKWLYSHHGTDPCCEREVNAFDLVRIHKFGNLDNDSNSETPVNRLPSFNAMEDFIRDDKAVSRIMAEDQARELMEDFDGLADDIKENVVAVRAALDKDKKGIPFNSPKNFGIILRTDIRLKDVVRLDVFHDRMVLSRDLPWRPMSEHPYWRSSDEACLIEFMSSEYGLQGKQAIQDAFIAATSRNWFHPVKDYLGGLPEWDGTPRLDTILIDYLGAADNELTRAMTRKHFTAAVARILRPGCKYDYVLTLIGPEGVGKSTIIRKLAKEWFDDSFSPGNLGDKESMDQLRGRWIIELGELNAYKRAEVAQFKQFLSKQDDNYRKAYRHDSDIYLRECVFFATTNEMNFLKGETGNRRFWPVNVMEDLPTKDVFSITDGEVDQIWAEAVASFKAGEQLYLNAEMEKQARARQEDHNEIAADERIGIIEACIRRKLPTTWWSLSKQQRRDFYKTAAPLGEDEPFIRRDTICVAEVQEEFFGVQSDRYKNREIAQILRRMGLEPIGVARNRNDREYGVQLRFKIAPDFYGEKL